MICIRVDGNPKIGSGHVMRCITIAEELKKQSYPFIFLLADHESEKLIRDKHFAYEIMNTDYQNMDAELVKIDFFLKKYDVKLMLIDSYKITQNYLEQLQRLVKIAYIDDMFLVDHPIDMLINYNIYATREKYSKIPKLLLGTGYTPLRKEFQNIKYDVRENVLNILITTGGGDQYNLAEKIVKKLVEFNDNTDCQFHIVAGSFHQNINPLLDLEKNQRNVKIHRDVNNMSDLMQSSDIAISAGGTTMFELCAVGIPIVCFSFVDNQERAQQYFIKEEVALNGGNYLIEKNEIVNRIFEQVLFLKNNLNQRMKMSQKAKHLVDGFGASRIAEELVGFVKNQEVDDEKI
jgi:UDP-2,4-diacetamido-2,4,6-trideoxy-beta-L-altropyranose hydrolase